MTKKILTLACLLAISSMTSIAQVATTYRGAFAPAPEPMWTENWTNWNPQQAYYPAPTVNVSADITTNTTWTKNNVYLIQGTRFVNDGVTLTIEPGTIVRGDAATIISTLVIARGAKLIANGTPCEPIVFTSSQAPGSRTSGSWGGIIILGKAPNNLGSAVQIEGIAVGDPRSLHGGNIPNDNSGSLTYARIEFGGFVISANNEMNSLTMGSIGSGTTINHIQTSFGLDDAFEWFGGTVNADHLVSYRNLDDDFDTDNGFSGTIQFGLAVKDPAISDNPAQSTSEGWESDNNNPAPFTNIPKTTAKFYNITQIGAFRCTDNSGGITQPTAIGFARGARIRRGSELQIHNSILMNNRRGLVMDNTVLTSTGVPVAGSLAAFKNNVIAMNYAQTFTAPYAGLAVAGEDAPTNAYLNNLANGNNIISTPCDVLTNAWDFLNPDYRPNNVAGTSGAALAGADLTPGIQIENALFTANAVSELVVDIFENAVGNSNGTITVSVPVPSGFTIAVPSIASLSATPTSGTNGTSTNLGAAYNNGDWNFSLISGVVTATSKPGISIPAGGLSSLGFTIKRNATTPTGTNSNIVVTVSGGADSTPANNGASNAISAI